MEKGTFGNGYTIYIIFRPILFNVNYIIIRNYEIAQLNEFTPFRKGIQGHRRYYVNLEFVLCA